MILEVLPNVAAALGDTPFTNHLGSLPVKRVPARPAPRLPHECSDGGRREEGFAHERRDCAVRAVAVAFQVTYSQAHSALEKFGRKPKHGTYFSEFIQSDACKSLGRKVELRADLSCHTLAGILPAMQKGHFIVKKAGHVFAVINGVIFDTFQQKPKSRVKMVYEIL